VSYQTIVPLVLRKNRKIWHEHRASRRLTGDTWAANCSSRSSKIGKFGIDGENYVFRRRISQEKCERTIREMYGENNEVPNRESHAFEDDIDTLLPATLVDLEVWIALTRPLPMKALRRVATLAPRLLTTSVELSCSTTANAKAKEDDFFIGD